MKFTSDAQCVRTCAKAVYTPKKPHTLKRVETLTKIVYFEEHHYLSLANDLFSSADVSSMADYVCTCKPRYFIELFMYLHCSNCTLSTNK